MVKAKKHLGQHFLRDLSIAEDIVNGLTLSETADLIIEVGPGTGVLSQYLIKQYPKKLKLVEVDRESIAYLKKAYPHFQEHILDQDLLKMDLGQLPEKNICLIGNFPYNISTQIIFKALEHRAKVIEVVGMFQKEVAERIASPPGNKTYGIMSVLAQAYFKTEYLYTVDEHVFDPPPKVKSAIIRLTRYRDSIPNCDEKFLFRLVKLAFNQRRKTLRNALKSILPEGFQSEVLQLRAERLSAEDFIELSRILKDQV
ncbi:MAG: 16S rRNA (adenine(1518)-N(6)/adenine(1519)-N(6))-dimethyltransferase RsmA [Flavobacteriales bacterium]|nr:16S rRNA (adenine(1518)-N(6)/adenine(1519)-N(6))-dimethyltransferase RsmA [Flavobacteriales bacterium]